MLALCVVLIGQRSDTAIIDQSAECVAAVRGARPDAVDVCRYEYQRTWAPATGVRLAEALVSTGDYDAARRVAAALLDTHVKSDALYTIGEIYRAEDNNDEALTAIRAALELHRDEQKPREVARDSGMLAMIRTARSEFAEALQLIDGCITNAQLASDKGLESYCHLAAAMTLIAVGYVRPAENELEKASLLVDSDLERSDLEYQGGNFAQESGDHDTAIVRFRKALRYRAPLHDDDWTITTELNLAYSLAEQGALDDAQEYLDDANRRDWKNDNKPNRTWTAARIAYRRGELTRAADLTDGYFALLGPGHKDDPEGLNDRIEVAVLGARIALERNALEEAAKWAQVGFDMAERVRNTQTVRELRPWVLAKRRETYELRFIALARMQRVEAAVMAFDQWQGRTVQDSLATPRPPMAPDYRVTAAQLNKLSRWLDVASEASIAKDPDQNAVMETMRRIELVALIVANGEVWRLVADHGPPQLSRITSRITPLAEIQDLVRQLHDRPNNTKVAAELGALLLPESAFRNTSDVLHVLVDGQLRGLPVAGLRRGGAPLIAMRPIVRVLRLPETRCARRARAGSATVIGAADKKIPLAEREAREVAELLHTTSQTGADATRSALFAAAHDAVLHVAAHGAMGDDGASLVLADGEVSALELPVLGIAPSLAVLTACVAAVSADPELAGSLAAGFLAAGTQHVVATLSSLSDDGGRKIGTRFYLAGGIADPPRALAKVQAELAKTDNTDWPNVVVFGPEVCTEDSRDRR